MKSLQEVLEDFRPLSEDEAADVARLRQLAAEGDPWTRASALHATGSAVIIHPPTRRVLLRWHERMQAWLQVGGHADPGETHPLDIALREAREETGLSDLAPWPDAAHAAIIQVAIVPVPAGRGEPEHQHADVRYVLSTGSPERIAAESEAARLAWLDLDEAIATVAEDNLRVCLERLAALWR